MRIGAKKGFVGTGLWFVLIWGTRAEGVLFSLMEEFIVPTAQGQVVSVDFTSIMREWHDLICRIRNLHRVIWPGKSNLIFSSLFTYPLHSQEMMFQIGENMNEEENTCAYCVCPCTWSKMQIDKNTILKLRGTNDWWWAFATGRKGDMFLSTRRNIHCKKNGLEDNK